MVPLQFFKVVDISLQFTYSEIHTITTPSFTDPYHSLRLSIVWVRCQAYMYPPSFRMDDFYPCPQPRRPILCRPLFPVLLATSQRRPASREGSGEWPALAFHPTSPCPPPASPATAGGRGAGSSPKPMPPVLFLAPLVRLRRAKLGSRNSHPVGLISSFSCTTPPSSSFSSRRSPTATLLPNPIDAAADVVSTDDAPHFRHCHPSLASHVPYSSVPPVRGQCGAGSSVGRHDATRH